MKATYVRPGGPLFPKRDKAPGIGLAQFFWDATDPAPPTGLRTVLDDMRAEHRWVGTTRDPSWSTPYPDAVTFAGMLSADIARLAGAGIQHGTIADIEAHDPAYVLAVMKEFRRLRPGRYLYWTFEPLQGGGIPSALTAWINTDPFTWVVPELYYGEKVNPPARRPVSERAVLEDLASAGIRDAKIKCYYDRFCDRFDGILFDWAAIEPGL